jgi:hypothetical protein
MDSAPLVSDCVTGSRQPCRRRSSPTAEAISYALNHWEGLSRSPLSGARNPYPASSASLKKARSPTLLLVRGDPIADIKLLEDPTRNLVAIMKDVKIFKNTLTKS